MKIDIYLIRHVPSQKLMPQLRRGKGYSHWNPSVSNEKLAAELPQPRIFMNIQAAKQAVAQWFAMPNAEMREYTTLHGEGDYGICFKEDGRKKEDLEIIPARIVMKT